MNNSIYDITTKKCLFITAEKFPRIPVKGDFINLSDFTASSTDYEKFVYENPYEVVAVVLNAYGADIYVDLNKNFE